MDEYKCSFDNNYELDEFARGAALVISMTSHRNEMKDFILLAECFGFEIVDFSDCTTFELQKRLNILAGNRHIMKECFFCIVDAHGGTDPNGNGYIVGNYGGDTLLIFEDIMKPFLESKYLRGKPKVFFVNGRRQVNKRTDSSTSAASSASSQKEEGKRRMHKTIDLLKGTTDVLAVFSTSDHFLKILRRTWDVFDGGDLLSIITDLNDEWCHMDETPIILTTLNEELYWGRRTKIKDFGPDLPQKSGKRELRVAANVVGQTQHFSDIKDRVLKSKAKLCAITGMMGIGKSTLAKSLYNDLEIQEHFQVFWLENTFNIGRHREIAKKQRLLLRQLGKNCLVIEGKECWIEEIQQCFKDVSPFMLILDDVWFQTHIEEMLGSPLRNVIPDGCICLITTRMKETSTALLDLSDPIIDLDFLNEDDSYKLFCMHAFGEDKIPRGLDLDLVIIVEQTIKACGNLPILLESIGTASFGKIDIAGWKRKLNLLQEADPWKGVSMGTQWDKDIIDLPSKIEQLFCKREGKVISYNQSLVFKYLVDCTARYTKYFWIGRFQLFTSGRSFGTQLLMALNRGLELLQECADKDPANLVFISIMLIRAGEFHEIVDDVTRFSKKLINLTPSCDPAKKKQLQNKLDLDCSMLQDSLRLAYEQDKHALILHGRRNEKPKTARSSWLVSSNEEGLFKRFLPSGLIPTLEIDLHPLASRIAESDLSIPGFWKTAPVAITEFNCDSDFEHEYKLRTKLLSTNSFHIVQILGHSEIKFRKCLVMEKTDVGLRDINFRYSFHAHPLYVVIDTMLQIAKGMRDLHRDNVTHGNITDSDFRVKFRKDGRPIVKLYGCENSILEPGSPTKKQQDIHSFGIFCEREFDLYLWPNALSGHLHPPPYLLIEGYYGPEHANIYTNLRVILDECLTKNPSPSFEELCNRLCNIKEKYIEEVAASFTVLRKLEQTW